MNKDKKRELLKELVISEEDVLQKLVELVKKSKQFIKIEEKTGKIIFENIFLLSNREKIILILIGKYFANELEYITKKSMTLPQISKELLIPQTTLSGPMGTIIKQNIVNKINSEYEIVYYKISGALDEIIHKNSGVVRKKRIIKKSKKNSVQKNKKQTFQKIKILHVGNKEGITKLATDCKATAEELTKIYDFEEGKVHLLVCDNFDSEKEKLIYGTILLLTAYNYYFNEKEIESSELRQKLYDCGIMKVNNLSTLIKQFKSYIIHKKGPKGSTKTKYRITNPGINMGKQIIQKILGKIDNLKYPLFKDNVPKKGLGIKVDNLIKGGFLNNPVPVSKIKEELDKKGFRYPRGNIDAYLRKVLLVKSIVDRKKINKVWNYYKRG